MGLRCFWGLAGSRVTGCSGLVLAVGLTSRALGLGIRIKEGAGLWLLDVGCVRTACIRS